MRFSSELLQVDEAIEVLERRDQEVLMKEQKTASERCEEVKRYRAEYARKRQAVHAAAVPAAKAKAKAKAKCKAVAKPKLPCSVPHHELKQYIPEGTSVWRDLTRGAFCAECPPYRRFSKSWHLYGQEGAMREVVKDLWRLRLQHEGKSLSECPIADLFCDTGKPAA